MAVNVDNIEYYKSNVLRPITSWNLLSNATVSEGSIVIRSGGSAGYVINNSYNNGLKACRYRSINIEIGMEINQQYNYENYVEVILRGEYVDNEDNRIKSYQSINITYLEASKSGGVVNINRVLAMRGYDFETLTVYLVNHGSGDITLTSCLMKRSQDVSGSQVGESIGWGIALSKVVGYLDGCEVYYDGDETPTKMWWNKDTQGRFSGVNVDNKRLIKFERKNEILLD